jgi:hypothetical protein
MGFNDFFDRISSNFCTGGAKAQLQTAEFIKVIPSQLPVPPSETWPV